MPLSTSDSRNGKAGERRSNVSSVMSPSTRPCPGEYFTHIAQRRLQRVVTSTNSLDGCVRR